MEPLWVVGTVSLLANAFVLFDPSGWNRVRLTALPTRLGIFRWTQGLAPAAAKGDDTGNGIDETPAAHAVPDTQAITASSAHTNADHRVHDETVVDTLPDSNIHTIEVIMHNEADHKPAYSTNSGFMALASLWNSNLPETSPTMEMYHIPQGQSSRTRRWELLLEQKGILRFKQSLVLQRDTGNTKQICLYFGATARNCSQTQASFTAEKWLQNYQYRFARLESAFSLFNNTAPTFRTLVQLVLLRIYWTNLIAMSSFFEVIETDYAAASTEKRLPSLDGGFVRDIVAETVTLDEFSRCTVELSEALNRLLNVLEPSLGSTATHQDFRCLAAEIRGSCYGFTIKIDRLKRLLDQRVRYGELLYNLQDSTSTWLLTLLAAIFLPLSLAAGILSIQSRFSSLGPMLYDFVGVAVLLASIALIVGLTIYLIVNVSSTLKRLQRRFKVLRRVQIFSKKTDPYMLAFLGLVGLNLLLLLSLVLASFLVGMLMNIDLGWKVLGYGLAAWVGIYIFAGMVGLFTRAISWLCDAIKGI